MTTHEWWCHRQSRFNANRRMNHAATATNSHSRANRLAEAMNYIADVLDMTVDEALEFFEHIPYIKRKLETLHDVGLH